MELEAKRVLVVGLGRSGIGAARLCAERGARVTATDTRSNEELAEVTPQLPAEVALELGGHKTETFVQADLIVLSPGVPEIPELKAARDKGVPIIGELELASRFVEAPIIAITGTNGKSTTTTLLGNMLAATGRPTFMGGNLGAPLVEAVGTPAASKEGVLVVEVSSFQLETVETFHAQIALLLNLSEDHLDRHPDYESYLAAKAQIFARQTADDYAIVNGNPSQEETRRLAEGTEAQVLAFRGEAGPPSDEEPVPVAAWIDNDELRVKIPGGGLEAVPLKYVNLPGRHNRENALAAMLGARLMGASLQACGDALRAFRGLPHRMELVADIGGVQYYNDSKATNVGSVVGSLTGFDRSVILIAGGKDKGGDYRPLLPLMNDVVREVVVYGAARLRMTQAFAGVVPLHTAGDLPAAVRLAAALAKPGEAVVLSPACSSFDMFRNYEERGDMYASIVQELAEYS
jgi:UDP-N-acetylmuramoylalanine--D-glutamate ligase